MVLLPQEPTREYRMSRRGQPDITSSWQEHFQRGSRDRLTTTFKSNGSLRYVYTEVSIVSHG